MLRKIKLTNLGCVFLFMFFCGLQLHAQQRSITGTVKDTQGETLIGVSIMVKGEKTGTITDIDGKYSISVPQDGKTLVASYIGMKNLEVPISGKVVDITMSEDYSALEEVVVIGYGTAKRGEIAGAISSVGEKALKEAPVASAMEAMAGRMAGVHVTKTEGSPDADINIRVRGGSSITQDNSPLYVVDGFIVQTISDISPNDIESINVLKDASLTAIYGSEGANGVVLVTTKSGKEGKMSIDFNSYVGFSKVYNLTEVLSPYEFVYLQKELDPGASIGTSFYSIYGLWDDVDVYKSKSGRNWQKELYGNTGVHQNYNLSIKGGNESTKYNLSLTHDDKTYIMDNSEFARDNINLRINSKLNKNIDFDFAIRLSNTVIDGPSISSGKKLREAIKFAPVKGLSDITDDMLQGEDDYSIETIGNLKNPLSNVNDEYKKQKKFRNTYNAAVNWKPFKWLRFRSQVQYEFVDNNTDNIWVRGAGESSGLGGLPVARRITEKGNNWSFSNTLTFDKTFAKRHNLNVLIGQEMKHEQTDKIQVQSKFYPVDMSAEDILANWDKGESMPTYTTEGEPIRSYSLFGRVNYILDGKYIFTLNTRYDGKSVFGPDNRWGFFPGIAGAWRISEEKFMDETSEWLSNLKLRASYGEGGNAKVESSTWRGTYSTITSVKNLYYPNEKPSSALQLGNRLHNENLKWEAKVASNIAIDFGFLNERFSGSIDFYNDQTRDLILDVLIPVHSGYEKQLQNVGKTSNKGVEIALNGYIVDTKDFKLSANFNIAFNKNKIEKYASIDGKFSQESSGTMSSDFDYLAEEGREIGLMYGFVTEGMYSFDDFTWNETTKKWDLNKYDANGNLNPDLSTYVTTLGNYFGPGAIKLKDLDGDGKITGDDRKVIGRAQPKHTGGFGLNAQYKGFDLAAFFVWSYGNDIYNANKVDNTTYAGSKKQQNVSTQMSLKNRFTTIDPETGYNIYYGTYGDPERLKEINQGKTIWHPIINTTFMHSWAIEDGSFLRLNTLTLGYTLPSKLLRKAMIQNLRVYMTGYNLYCWTKYSGQDPEVSTRSNPLTPGVDYSAYPKSRSFVFGANITF